MMSEKEMLETMMKQLDSLSQQQAQLVGHISSLRAEMHERMDSLENALTELDAKVDTIRDGLQSDLAAVELTTYKTAIDMAKLKLAK